MTGALTPEGFQAATGVSRETLDRLILYAALLEKWQKAVNLVARATLDDVWTRHMLDSAQLAPLIPAGAARLLDLGSGAGFPGLVLAIMTGLPTRLIESDAKKGTFLREVARQAGAAVTVETVRIEAAAAADPADVITARALAPLDSLLGYAARFLAPGGVCLFLKGQSWEEELTRARATWTMASTTHPSVTNPQSIILKLEDPRHVQSAGQGPTR